MPIKQERIRFRYGICLNDKCEKCKSKEVQEIPARKDLICPECGKPLRECPPPKRSGNKWLYLAAAIIALLLIVGGLWWLSGSDEQLSSQYDRAEQLADSLRKDSLEKAINATVADSLKNDSIKDDADKAKQERDSLQAVADSLQRVANQQKAAPTNVPPAPAPVQSTTPTTKAAPSPTPKAAPASVSTTGSKNLDYAVFKGSLRNGQPDDVNGRLVFKSSHVIDSRDPKGRMAEPGDYVIGEFSEGHLVQGIWYDANNQVKGSIIIGK
ncbi:MAG: hypothetical protein J5529_06830 [Prevotella sp.]|nr:hypothetical protein [Prevotella sp.]